MTRYRYQPGHLRQNPLKFFLKNHCNCDARGGATAELAGVLAGLVLRSELACSWLLTQLALANCVAAGRHSARNAAVPRKISSAAHTATSFC